MDCDNALSIPFGDHIVMSERGVVGPELVLVTQLECNALIFPGEHQTAVLGDELAGDGVVGVLTNVIAGVVD